MSAPGIPCTYCGWTAWYGAAPACEAPGDTACLHRALTNAKKKIDGLVGRSTSEGAVGRERVLCTAIYVDTGEAVPPRASYAYPKTGLVFAAWRHGDCFTTLHAWAERLSPEERERIGEEQLAGQYQGFLTSRGRFVRRDEAMLIAREAGQTDCEKRDLFSEDLY